MVSETASRQFRSKTVLGDRCGVSRRPRLGSGNDSMRVKPTSAAAMLRSRQKRDNLRRGSEFVFPQTAIYSQRKPPKIDRTITCSDHGNVHVSVLNAPHSEEISSDTKKKGGFGSKVKAFRKNFSTGWKNKQKATLAPDASSMFKIFCLT